MTIKEITQPVEAQIQEYELRLRGWIESDYQPVSEIMNYILAHRGKGIRPLLVLLSHSLTAQNDSEVSQERAYMAAMLVEMIHSASLLHDDVIDEAYVRRGKPSVNALWRSKVAILAGDYILARSYMVGLQSGNEDVMRYITGSMGDLCEGELVQSDQSRRLEMTRDIYIDIVTKKTASLIASSSASGALAANASMDMVERMRRFGEYLGIAFQIQDDILDYSTTETIGKPTCKDLKERKITLPILTIFEECNSSCRRKILKLLSDVRTKPQNVDMLYDMVISGDGIAKAQGIMMDYIKKAKDELSVFGDSPVKSSLIELCDYVANREK